MNDIFVRIDLFDNFINVKFNVDFKMIGNENFKIEVYLEDVDGNKVVYVYLKDKMGEILFVNELILFFDVNNVKLWSVEEFNLYIMYILVYKYDNSLVEVVM